MEYVTGYLVGVVATMIISAVRTPNNDLRPVTLISLLWFIAIPVILITMILNMFNIMFDLNKGNTAFGIRKSPNPMIAGFGVTAFGLELQFYRVRKV